MSAAKNSRQRFGACCAALSRVFCTCSTNAVSILSKAIVAEALASRLKSPGNNTIQRTLKQSSAYPSLRKDALEVSTARLFILDATRHNPASLGCLLVHPPTPKLSSCKVGCITVCASTLKPAITRRAPLTLELSRVPHTQRRSMVLHSRQPDDVTEAASETDRLLVCQHPLPFQTRPHPTPNRRQLPPKLPNNMRRTILTSA